MKKEYDFKKGIRGKYKIGKLMFIYTYECEKCESTAIYETDTKITIRPKCGKCNTKLKLIKEEDLKKITKERMKQYKEEKKKK